MIYPVSGAEVWENIGKPIFTADVSGTPTITQRFRHPSKNMVVIGAQIGVILYNDPVFTSLTAKIYADRDGAVGKLLGTSSNSYTQADCLETESHGLKFAGFTFDKLNLKSSQWYHLALIPTVYTGDASSHIAWRTSYPDPQYPTGLTLNAAKAAKHHLDFGIIGALLGGEN